MEKKIVLVTGSSRGIGLAVAKTFATEGYHVILNCKSSEKLMNKEVEALRSLNYSADGFVCDVSDYQSVLNLFSKIINIYGKIDVLVNNAGIADYRLFTDLPPNDFEHIMSCNFNSVLNCSHLAAKDMLKRKDGAIINISSVWGICGASCEVLYSASKGAVNAFTSALAKELAPSGIRVNAVACGVIDTSMNDHLPNEEREYLKESIPMGRMGTADEIAALVLFLADKKKSAYITGQVIKADGGFL